MRDHLQSGCVACAGYHAEAQALLAAIPLGLPLSAPPADLKRRLFARIDAAEAGSGKGSIAPASGTVVSMRGSPTSRGVAGPATGNDSLPIRLFRYLVPAAVAAGLAIVATHFVMNQRVQAARQEATAAKSVINEKTLLEFQVRQLNKNLDSQTRIVEILQSPEVKLVHLDHTANQPNAIANLIWDQKHQQWAMFAAGMTPAAKGQTYELWFVTDKGAFAAGLFDVDDKGNGWVAVNIPPDIGQLEKAAVTNEAAGGTKVPAGQYQVLGKLD